MAKLSLSSLGPHVRKKRGTKGIRETANKIGISTATLSRVENGRLPDLDTFAKICRWLNIDPGEILDCSTSAPSDSHPKPQIAYAHMRSDKNPSPDVAKALGEMILAAQDMLSRKS